MDNPAMPIEPDLLLLAAEEVAALRTGLFRESLVETIERNFLRWIWAVKHYNLALLPFAAMWMREAVAPRAGLPDSTKTVIDGECAGIVHDLSPDTLTSAYERGLYTSDHYGALTWTSPPERCVLFFDRFRMNKNVRRLMRQKRYTVTFDRAFERIVKACAGRRAGKWHTTWITPRIMRAYAALFDRGLVHSFEVWNGEGALVGGGYGVALGRVFFTESQFSHEGNTSKIGFSVLNRHLAEWGYILNDGKKHTPTLEEQGFEMISRADFQHRLGDGVRTGGKPGRWQVQYDTAQVADWQPTAAALAAE
jgi:leucyl/phenylalanyl-tRNA--protein transferase